MGAPNILVPVALAAFVLITAACFRTMPPTRAVLASLLGGWLFLPHIDSRYSVLFVHSKAAFVPAVVFLWSVIFDGRRLGALRLRLLDLPVAVLCGVPFATAIANDLGVYEATAAMVEAAMTWGTPYLLGRMYFGDPRAQRALVVAIVGAALVYVPFSLWEIRMSPQLQMWVYGFRSWGFTDAMRFGGFRPNVFMQHGLAVGFFMAMGTLGSLWLWRTKARSKVAGIPVQWVFVVLAVTTLLCKSVGAIILLAVGAAVLEGTRVLRRPVLLAALLALPPVYSTARISGWMPEAIVAAAHQTVDVDRGDSLQFRLDNEDRLIAKAMLKPWLGWGRFGRSFVYDEQGNNVGAITDGLWILVLGINGLLGLIAVAAVLTLSPLAALRTLPARHWSDPRLAGPAVLVVVVLLWVIDDLLNAMMTPLYPLISGALVSLVSLVAAAHTARARTHRQRGAVIDRQGAVAVASKLSRNLGIK